MNLKSKGVFKNLPAVFLLLLIVTAVFIPLEEAKALDIISFDIFSIITDFIAKLLKGDSEFMTFIYWLAYRIIGLALYVTTILVYFGSWLVDVFLDQDIYASVLNMNDPTSAVSIGWTTVRDACNTFFILFLLVIAFSTILRIQAYNAKSLLPKLIISLFLINFSATIAMMVIDFGQVFMFEIKAWMGAGGFSEAGSPLTTIVDYFHNEYGWHKPPPSEAYLMSDVVGIMFAVAYSAVLGLLYIMLALFLIVRIIVFVILVIISPFAFFSIILPGMRTYTSQWWQSLVSHAIFGPVFLFFIFLSGKMAQSMETFNSTVPEPDDIAPLTYIIAKLIPHVVAMGMLMAAIPVTQKLGVAGASKFIGGAAGLGKIGIGVVAGAKLAGGAGKKVGGGIDRRTGRRISDWGRKKKEDILLKVPGGLGMGEVLKGQAKTEKKKEENMKEIRLEFGTEGNRNLDMLKEKANKSSATTEDRAIYAEEVVAQKKMGDKKYSEDVKRFMPEIARTLSGNDLEKLTDRSLSLAVETTENKKKIKSRANDLEGTRNETTGKNYTRKEAEIEADLEIRKELVNDLVEKGETHKLQDTNEEPTAKAYREVVKGEQRKSDMNRMSPMQRAAMAEGNLKNIKTAEELGKLEGEELKEAEEDNVDLSSDIVKLGKELDEAFAWGGDDAAEKIKEAFPEFDHRDVAKMSSKDIDDYGYSATDKQITGLNKAGEYKTVRRIYASMEKYDPKRYNEREKNKPISPSPDKGSGGGEGGTKTEEPGERWKEKMKEKAGGGGSRGSGSGESSKKNKKSFLGDESGEANLTSAIPKKTKREKESGGKVKKDRGSRAAIIDDADTNKPRRSFWKDESASVGLTGGAKSKTTTDKKAETKPQDEKTGVKKAVDSYKEYAKKTSPGNVKKKVIDPVARGMNKASVPIGKAEIAALKVARFYPPARTVSTVAIPILEKGVKIAERKDADPSLTNNQILREEAGKLKGGVKSVVSRNADEVAGVAGNRTSKAFNEAAENASGKTKIALKAASSIAGSKVFQGAVSEQVKKVAGQNEEPAIRTEKKITKMKSDKNYVDLSKTPTETPSTEKAETKPQSEEAEEQTKIESASKQWKIKEDKEKIIEVKESVSKGGLKSSVVKSEITFNPTSMSKERADQIKKAMRGMSNNMKQEITNNIAVDSSQEPIVDLGKLINPKEIAKLVEEGINVKDVEKSLKDVKKSFNKFRENKGENAIAPIFGAGISAAETALEKAQAKEDHKEQAIEIATISEVLGKIKSGMKGQGKVNRKEEE
ncbi:hypothetical protein KAI56_01835 [Candidatus Parcubacteria bacterium]|nr:hypothetical protein [Candidatus Parcubacteria bacterium]